MKLIKLSLLNREIITNPIHIGIGLPITEEPSHTTWHTDRIG